MWKKYVIAGQATDDRRTQRRRDPVCMQGN